MYWRSPSGELHALEPLANVFPSPVCTLNAYYPSAQGQRSATLGNPTATAPRTLKGFYKGLPAACGRHVDHAGTTTAPSGVAEVDDSAVRSMNSRAELNATSISWAAG